MTQLYKINTAVEMPNEAFGEIINEWGALHTRFEVSHIYGHITDEERSVYHSQSQSVSGFACLYRKNGRNFLWRGRHVPSSIRLRLINAYAEKELEGTLVLYKAGSSSTRANQEKYPIRLINNEYAFVTGDTRFLRVYGRDNDLMIYDSDSERHQRAEMVYNLWGSENLLDYHINTEAFKRRAFYVLMLKDYMSLGDYESYYTEYSEL